MPYFNMRISTCVDVTMAACHGGAGAQPKEALRPADAFTEGREAAARQRLFDRIAPVYDQVPAAHLPPCHAFP